MKIKALFYAPQVGRQLDKVFELEWNANKNHRIYTKSLQDIKDFLCDNREGEFAPSPELSEEEKHWGLLEWYLANPFDIWGLFAPLAIPKQSHLHPWVTFLGCPYNCSDFKHPDGTMVEDDSSEGYKHYKLTRQTLMTKMGGGTCKHELIGYRGYYLLGCQSHYTDGAEGDYYRVKKYGRPQGYLVPKSQLKIDVEYQMEQA